uniref:HAD hydrolase n=1 Tax=Kwoniella dejecticola CBS 10117 TaxID=1296121 RepID=A0A1A6A9N2_9TREE|nr:HAD hydrolase [Kwoniella dejecticola CBS 10117]OBR86764.1 HAD hydrolase [Kwoniella dejecticola CBS 10117]
MSKPSLKLKALLIDLNGTLHVGSDPTNNAVKAIERLRKSKIPFIFCSNSTKESSAHLLSSLNEIEFRADKEELMTSLSACKEFVRDRGYKRPYLLMSDSAKQEFASPPNSVDQPYDSVILGLHPPSLTYDNLNIAFRILKQEPIDIASTSSQSGHDYGSKGLSLGIGLFVTLLEEAGGVRAEIVGKPTKRFFELAIERLRRNADFNDGLEGDGELEYKDVGMIGDDISNDLGEGAKELGLTRILVKTGKYRPGSEKSEHPPDHAYENFAKCVDDLLDHRE